MDVEPTGSADRFGGILRLYGRESFARFAAAHVCILGVGGVGSWTAEALVRSGVGALTLVDLDDVCVTNTNRQAHTLASTIGRPKVDVMAERLRDINPDASIRVTHEFVDRENVASILSAGASLVVDAIDAYREKLAVIEHCVAHGIPLVVAGAAGGRRDATRVIVDDLNRTAHDPLLRRVRRELRRNELAGARERRWGIPSVFSSESPVFPTADGGVSASRPSRSAAIDCGSGMGTVTHVTGTFGFLLAGAALELLARDDARTDATTGEG